MNWEHLSAVLWLNWRMSINRTRRGGALNAMVKVFVAALSVMVALITFVIGLALGALLLRTASAQVMMLVWDGITAAFLFVSMAELVSELQRSEPLTIDKFLHLPVSLSGIFLINYLSSVFTLAVTIFLPLQAGLILGQAISRSAGTLAMAPVAAGFFLLVTALVHQFRGWLASLMQNKRRRRNIITLITFLFVLVAQGPNFWVWMNRPARGARNAVQKEVQTLNDELAKGRISPDQYKHRVEESYKKHGVPQDTSGGRNREQIISVATAINTYVPLGWPAYAMKATIEREFLPPLLATSGLLALAMLSLARSYITTRRIYTGEFTGGKPAPVAEKAPPAAVPGKNAQSLLERSIPRVSEHTSAIATATFRSFWRAPEGKMMLLTPIIFSLLFGSLIFRRFVEPPEYVRLLIAMGGLTIVMIGLSQMAGNQFGFDRSGFRVFVLSSAPRQDILLGKNLALAPFALLMGLFPLVVIATVYPIRIDHLLASALQTIAVILIFCVLCNFMSILAPMFLPAGSLKPAKPKGMAVLAHVAFLPVFAASVAITGVPLAIEYVLHTSYPIELALMPVVLLLVAIVYRAALRFQGGILQQQEQKILSIVASPD